MQAVWGAILGTRDTVFFDLRTAEERVIIVLKLLLCKVELTSISFAMGVTEETILEWFTRQRRRRRSTTTCCGR